MSSKNQGYYYSAKSKASPLPKVAQPRPSSLLSATLAYQKNNERTITSTTTTTTIAKTTTTATAKTISTAVSAAAMTTTTHHHHHHHHHNSYKNNNNNAKESRNNGSIYRQSTTLSKRVIAPKRILENELFTENKLMKHSINNTRSQSVSPMESSLSSTTHQQQQQQQHLSSSAFRSSLSLFKNSSPREYCSQQQNVSLSPTTRLSQIVLKRRLRRRLSLCLFVCIAIATIVYIYFAISFVQKELKAASNPLTKNSKYKNDKNMRRPHMIPKNQKHSLSSSSSSLSTPPRVIYWLRPIQFHSKSNTTNHHKIFDNILLHHPPALPLLSNITSNEMKQSKYEKVNTDPKKVSNPASINNKDNHSTTGLDIPLLGNSDTNYNNINNNQTNDEDSVDTALEEKGETSVKSKIDDSCIQLGDWQTQSFLNCNTIHELGMTGDIYNIDVSESGSSVLGQGWFRTTWKVETQLETFVLKTLRLERDFIPEFYDLHRKDAVAMERLTHSHFVMNVYGYCGQSAINEFADFNHADITSLEQLDRRMRGNNSPEALAVKLRLAVSVAVGVAHVHEVNLPRYYYNDETNNNNDVVMTQTLAPMTHYDLNPRNVAIVKGGKPKLNDFNVAEFLSYNPATNKTCGFKSRLHEPWWRAPEEMDITGNTLVNEKVDVYALGNILFHIFTTKSPRGKMKRERMPHVREAVQKGIPPTIPSPFNKTADPISKSFRKALRMCYEPNPEKRATAREVADVLYGAMTELKAKDGKKKKI